PSPPRPTDEWFPAERARAIRDLVGDARPAVQVPTPDGKRRVAFDPWAPEFMAEPACPLTKLPASMCAHCRGKDLPARLQEASASGGQTIIGLPWSRPPLSMNDNGATRGARFARARKIADIRRDMVTLARKAGLPKGVRYATITLHYRPRDNTPRDTVNLAPTVKALVDGLTPQKVVPTKRGFNVHAGYGFVPDDSTRHVSTPESVIHRAERGKPGAMWLELTWQG
ncbi:hypothetical protein ACIA5H_37290, partial [Nocardia sp. NPDC051900]|uniref:hypothetical protein n=1 Tax=Nocardia sp. NPDC051900 TaxID=3364326 RepID=UPI0037A692F8